MSSKRTVSIKFKQMEQKSIITAVTVYTDRAQVTRRCTAELIIGENSIIFDKLPKNVDPNNIQVNGKGAAIIKDVRFKKKQYEEIADELVLKLQKERQEVQDELSIVEDNIALANGEKDFVKQIVQKLTEPSQNKKSAELEPDKWVKMVSFYRQKMAAGDKEIRDYRHKQRVLLQKADKLTRELKDFGSKKEKTKNIVEVIVQANNEGQMHLDLTYIVPGPSWYPVYDLRIDSENKNVNIAYNAIVRQNTGENWEDVSLSLSTAKPRISGSLPSLRPWRIDIYKEIDDFDAKMDFEKVRAPLAKTMKKAKKEMQLSAGMMKDFAEAVEELPELEISEANVVTGATSVLFTIDGGSTISGNNQEFKVAVMMRDFPAEFSYSSVPKLSQFAYLTAKVKNVTDFPFLAGKSNIYLDNAFVANSKLELVAPDEEFETFLGVDEAMKVEYKFIKKYETTEGLISKKTKFAFEYKIIITNKKKTEEKITLKDQLPIAQHDDIAVELIKPDYKKDTTELKINEEKEIEWSLKIAAGQKLEIPFSFSIEYPKSESLTGL